MTLPKRQAAPELPPAPLVVCRIASGEAEELHDPLHEGLDAAGEGRMTMQIVSVTVAAARRAADQNIRQHGSSPFPHSLHSDDFTGQNLSENDAGIPVPANMRTWCANVNGKTH
ncbi:hypothetical protein E3C22_02845 [Jiella endophytica]|uniref:Uncharacterized protein n=1 Tax=Jiella endophytica TaxID=2558362 RepID=A0A4Y8RTW2_9HYPH|nr:hypothetical protein [Jiella endophytica]TFF27413.1 hypothetical protein E3C22_02845 [Jiella endophytica]